MHRTTRSFQCSSGGRTWLEDVAVVVTTQDWQGRVVTVEYPEIGDAAGESCEDGEHNLEVLTHYGEPTDFLICRRCSGTAVLEE